MHLPLKKRQEILKQVIEPNRSPQIFCTVPEDSEWSVRPRCLKDLKDFFWQMVEKGNEGIVVKDLSSLWTPDNRDGRWCKIKPDYVFMGSDLDLLIIGGYFGTGSRGGKIASFLMALVDERGESTSFISVCRCGHGLTEEEFCYLESKLSPYLIRNSKEGKPPATCGYLVTNSRYNCPDVWISRPEMSVVLQVSSEKRIYPTQAFKSGWTFRFPRIVKVRYDKCWKEALHVQEFEDIVRAANEHGNSMLHGHQKYSQLFQSNRQMGHKSQQGKRCQSVFLHLQNLDVSHVEQVDSFFKGLIFYICSSRDVQEKNALQIYIKRAGGRTVPNLVPSVTHIIACEAKGFQFQVAADNDRDIICLSWVSACIEAKKLLPFSPRHYLFLSQTTKKKLEFEIDGYGDPWFGDISPCDLVQVFKNISTNNMPNGEQRPMFLRKKRKLSKGWIFGGLFEGCHVYFHKPIHSANFHSQVLAMTTLNRLRLEAEMLGASVSSQLMPSTTHIIVYVPSNSFIPTKKLLQSFKHYEKTLIHSSSTNIVSHFWLEECLRKKEMICTSSYLVRKGVIAVVSKSKDANTDTEPENASSTCGMASEPHPVEIKPCPSASVVGSGHAEQMAVACRRSLVSPKCSRWGGPLGKAKTKTPDDNCAMDIVTADGRKEGSLEIQKGHFDPACNAAAMPTVDVSSRLEYSCTLTLSATVWESDFIQDIAQVYLGTVCKSSDAGDGHKKLSLPQLQTPQGCPMQNLMTAKISPAPACIPKRRFTSRDWLD